MRKQWEVELKVGIFLSIGLGLMMLAIIMLGSTKNIFVGKNNYEAHFSDVEGLIAGAKVVLGGVPVGTVDHITFDHSKHDIVVKITVSKDAIEWIRKDSTLEIATQGVLGDKYISISPGSQEQPVLPNLSEIPNRPSKDFSVLLSQSDQLVVSLRQTSENLNRIFKSFQNENRNEVFFKGLAATAKNLASTSEKLNQQINSDHLKQVIVNLKDITDKINSGSGTLGALVNDNSLYDEIKSLTGGANRNRVVRNLVRQTLRRGQEKQNDPSPKEPSQ